ncbi:carbohydrate sulfotransferase 11-like [Pecten maximus]|uniref:carbohydrate sulfotransferase 11-like n=1 Tax=Pecten maximus TaxID=6579 RepID=UPI001458AF9B|nr:carbohydrate sulfotransferase 11-like [Pecten maximus]XP_033764294.1 carbohydrate sulfotransferase 11-like [Pecten maximus]
MLDGGFHRIRWIRISLLLAILLLLGVIVQQMFTDTYQQHEELIKSGPSKAVQQGQGAVQPNNRAAFTSEPWKTRLATLQRGCASGTDGYKLTSKQVTQRYYNSDRAGFSVCKVPKAGSTFWTIVYVILEKRQSAEKVFSMPRNSLHNMGNNMGSREPAIGSHLNIIISREPYSRLFSGFIDKIFLPGQMGHSKGKHSRLGRYSVNGFTCGFNKSFSEFLDTVTEHAFSGGKIDRHWSPVYLLCDACKVTYQAVSHTTTLTADTEYIVNNLKVSDSEKNSLKRMFHKKEMNQTLKGLLEDLARVTKPQRKNCPDRIVYVYRLWQSLQIQGYLHTQSTFPWEFFKNETNLEDHLIINRIIDAMTKRPVSSKQRALQRRAALVSAYQTVGKETIRRVQQMFMMDFRLFGYDMNPPS